MHITIIPGSYKSFINSSLVCDILYQKINGSGINAIVDRVYIADGGEGTLEAASRNFSGKKRSFVIKGMQGRSILVDTLWFDNTVLIESSSVVGYSLVDGQRNPWFLTSHSLGELILLVKAQGARKIIITMGDSAVMDVGMGMLEKLGIEFYDSEYNSLTFTDLSTLNKIEHFNCDCIDNFKDIEIVILGDTKDFLIGEYGQVNVYGAQKGLQELYANMLEDGYLHIVDVIKRELGVDITNVPMTSGSGGIAAGLFAFFNSELFHCPLFFAKGMNLSEIISSSDIIITGEGKLDNQTRWGKIPFFVSEGFEGIIILLVSEYTKEGFDDICNASNSRVIPVLLKPNYSIIESFEDAANSICKIIKELT